MKPSSISIIFTFFSFYTEFFFELSSSPVMCSNSLFDLTNKDWIRENKKTQTILFVVLFNLIFIYFQKSYNLFYKTNAIVNLLTLQVYMVCLLTRCCMCLHTNRHMKHLIKQKILNNQISCVCIQTDT